MRAIQSNRWTSDEIEQGELYYDDHLIGQCMREIRIQEKGRGKAKRTIGIHSEAAE